MLKREDRQRCKLYKTRGALFKYLKSSPEERAKGFVTGSDGNFAQVMSELASILHFKLTLFVPTVCPIFKLDYIRHVGGDYV